MSAQSRLGLAVMRVFINLMTVPPSPATTSLDATSRAGRLTDLSVRIQRHGRLPVDQARTFATLSNLSEADMRLWGFGALEKARAVLVERDGQGNVLWLEEQVGVRLEVLELTAALWDAFGPSDVERATVASAPTPR